MPTAAVKPEPPTLIWPIRSLIERLDWARLFGRSQPIEMELGAGDGSFLVQYARGHPDRNFVGVERLLGRLRKLDRKGLRAGLNNLRLVRLEAAYLLEYLVPLESLVALHVYFPDPWPKRKHWKKRLINERFPDLVRRVLVPGGVVYLRTDNADYFAQMTTVFGAHSGFHAVETPAELAGLLTDFEREFQARGVPTLRAAFQRYE